MATIGSRVGPYTIVDRLGAGGPPLLAVGELRRGLAEAKPGGRVEGR